jgi:hypothetical protein
MVALWIPMDLALLLSSQDGHARLCIVIDVDVPIVTDADLLRTSTQSVAAWQALHSV